MSRLHRIVLLDLGCFDIEVLYMYDIGALELEVLCMIFQLKLLWSQMLFLLQLLDFLHNGYSC